MENIGKKVEAYFKGLIYTYLATLIFLALGWVKTGGSLELNKLVVSALVALIIWTFIFVLHEIIWILVLAFTACTFGFGIFIAVWWIGYLSLKIAAFLLPPGWISFSNDDIILLVIGGVYGLISLGVEPDESGLKKNKKKKISKNGEQKE